MKFYTGEGTFDLAGNNIPVFFIQDGIKFPDLIHAAKPHPDTEVPQAQSAHDTFWDFVSLHTQATHHVLWVMSDRGIPRSYRMMEGFGVRTFRVSDAEGKTALVPDLAAEVGAQLGLTPPSVDEAPKGFLSPAPSQLNRGVFPAQGRVIGIVVGSTTAVAGFDDALAVAAEAGVTVRLVASTGAPVDVDGAAIGPDRTYAATRSIEFDAVVILAAPEAELDARVITLIEEAYRHGKAMAFAGGFTAMDAGIVEDEGALTTESLADAVATLIEALGTHRVWSRLEMLGAQTHAS